MIFSSILCQVEHDFQYVTQPWYWVVTKSLYLRSFSTLATQGPLLVRVCHSYFAILLNFSRSWALLRGRVYISTVSNIGPCRFVPAVLWGFCHWHFELDDINPSLAFRKRRLTVRGRGAGSPTVSPLTPSWENESSSEPYVVGTQRLSL